MWVILIMRREEAEKKEKRGREGEMREREGERKDRRVSQEKLFYESWHSMIDYAASD